jgi:regulator of sigma E protease
MPEPKNNNSKYFRVVFFAVCVIALVLFIIKYAGAFVNVIFVMLGFGAVILVHEFGHFIVAKISNIKVEAFSIFMPPVLFGIQKTEKGFKIRILPEIFPKEGDETGEGALSFTIPVKCKSGETEYRIGLIPFGGFVKMLGQEDIGSVKSNNDPRSFANKPAHIRAAVISAGVCFNIISAVIIFMIAFLIGINLPPAKVGAVMPGSPAAIAGIKPGDEIIEIAGKSKDLDFTDISVAAALSGKDEGVTLKVKHPDTSEEEYLIKAEQMPGEQMRVFGILQESSLKISKLNKKDANDLYAATGLRTGDRIKAVNGQDIRGHWELMEIINNSFVPEIILTVERTEDDGQIKTFESKIPLALKVTQSSAVDSEIDLNNIYSIVPRLKIADSTIVPDSMESDAQNKGIFGKISYLFAKLGNSVVSIFHKKDNEEIIRPENPLHPGDIILAIGNIENPTYDELLETVKENKDKELPVRVLRKDSNGTEQEVTVQVTPKQPKGSDRVFIGIVPMLDAQHPVAAKTIDIGNTQQKLEIPRGATITKVDGADVSNFFDIIREIKKYSGEKITIDWRIDKETAGDVAIQVNADNSKLITVQPFIIEEIPFENLQETYKADGPIKAILMGYRKTLSFVAQTYVTLRRLLTGLVSPENLMGPVGIMRLSYRVVAEQPAVYYIYFLGLINAVIAVFNFLPVPPLDGGLVLLLIIEKLKGSPISEKTQTAIAYTTWALILLLVIYVTFNDLTRQI